MITGLIFAEGAPEELAVTLGALVPAVVEGLMGDAVVVARREDAGVMAIAEIAGATFATAPGGDPWQAGARLARRDWLLCLQSGDVPGEGWMRAVDRFLVLATRGERPLGRFSRRQGGLAGALLHLAEAAAGTRTVRPGDLVQRAWLAGNKAARVRPVRLGAAIERDVGRR